MIYKKVTGPNGVRYLKNDKFMKESRVPHEVMEKFEYTDSVDYDDKPDERRCLFCDDYQSRQKVLSSEMVYLCEWHYQNMNLGKIAAQVRLIKEEQDGVQSEEKASGKRKLKRRTSQNKTALSNYS